MWKILAAIAVILLICFTVFHHNSAPRKFDVTDAAAPQVTPAATVTTGGTNGDPSLQSEKEITFSKSLVVSHRTLVVDGGAPLNIPCLSDDSDAPTFFGYFTLADGTRVDLTCANGSDGTVQLNYPSQNGETQEYVIASSGNGEGAQWDLRSWLTRDPQNNLIAIRSITLSSTAQNVATEGEQEMNAACEVGEKLAIWNTDERDFTEAMSTGEIFDLTQFESPINVGTECLNSNGTWKKKD